MEQEVLQREATARDLARSVELNQQYIDILDEILDSDLTVSTEVTAVLDGETKVKFKNDSGLPEWLAEIMNG